jgi:hypothetical protein
MKNGLDRIALCLSNKRPFRVDADVLRWKISFLPRIVHIERKETIESIWKGFDLNSKWSIWMEWDGPELSVGSCWIGGIIPQGITSLWIDRLISELKRIGLTRWNILLEKDLLNGSNSVGKEVGFPHEIILCLQGSFLNDKRIKCLCSEWKFILLKETGTRD